MRQKTSLYFSVIFSLFTVVICWAQAPGELSQQATQFEEQEEWAKAGKLWQQAAQAYAANKQWVRYLDCGVHHSQALLKQNALNQTIETAEQYLQKVSLPDKALLEQATLYENIGRAYYAQQKFPLALHAMDKALQFKLKRDAQDPELARNYGNLGIISGLIGHYQKAIDYLNTALSYTQDSSILGTLYSVLAENHKSRGSYEVALENLQQAELYTTDRELKAARLNTKGRILILLGEFEQGIDLLKKSASKYYQEQDLVDYMGVLEAISGGFLNQSAVVKNEATLEDSAFYYIVKADSIAQDYYEKDNPNRLHQQISFANVCIEMERYEKAQKLLEEVATILATHKHLPIQHSMSMTYAKLALRTKAYKKALNYYQQAIALTVPSYTIGELFQTPTYEQSKKAENLDQLTDVLAFNARALQCYYEEGKQDRKILETALTNLKLFDQLIDLFRSQLTGKKTAWGDITLDAYENAIEICLQLYKATQNKDYQHQAFYFAEKSRSLSLLESFQESKAEESSGLPQEVLSQIKLLELKISDLEQNIYQLEQDKATDSLLAPLKKERFAQLEAKEGFIEQLEKQYPTYYQMKYAVQLADVEAVQALLAPKQALLEYFVGDSSCYVFKITATNFDIYDLGDLDDLSATVTTFRSSIYESGVTNNLESAAAQQQAQNFVSSAHQLYLQLLAPVGPIPERLVIVPAGPLANIPFEPFLTEKAETPTAYQEHAYLLRQHSISYAYSATLLQEMQNQQHKKEKKTFIGFAPEFGEGSAVSFRGNRFALSPLNYNKVEIEEIAKRLNEADVYIGKEATEEVFKEQGGNYSIVHFATHGMANNKNPDFSFLAFSNIEDSIENEFLYMRDLYTMELNADLVVLSACETGLGKMHKAEGVISMARGFSYAGAKSIFTTLWSVNDQATFEVIKGFYNNLQQGLPKDMALQRAKIAFISSNNEVTAHPFLWSPYILVGDMSPLEQIRRPGGVGYIWAFAGLGVLAVLLLGFGYVRRRRKVTE